MNAPVAATPVLHVVLFEPEIPPNTGNVMRLCANIGARLHLIRPLGFELDDRRLRRAGLDYRDFTDVVEHDTLAIFADTVRPRRIVACTTRAPQPHVGFGFQRGDALLFGPESRGLPAAMLDEIPERDQIRVPMVPGSRSLNLSNAVAVVAYEAWRQMDFAGADPTGHRSAIRRLQVQAPMLDLSAGYK